MARSAPTAYGAGTSTSCAARSGRGSATLGIPQLAVETFFVGSPGSSTTVYTPLACEVVATAEEWDVTASANCARLPG